MSNRVFINALPLVLPDGVQPWPQLLPDCQQGSLVSTVSDGRIISDMQQGPAKIREGSKGVVAWSGLFKMTAAQRLEYERFYEQDLHGGKLPTVMTVRDGRELAYSYVQIMGWDSWQQIGLNTFAITLNFQEVGRP